MAEADISRPAKRVKVDYTATVNVLVGPEEQLFVVYQNIFTSRSTFFRAACSDTWMIAKQDLRLPSDDPVIFNNYLACVCSGGLADQMPSELSDMIEVYCLADKLGDLQTANKLMDEMRRAAKLDIELPTCEDIKLAYSHTVDHSPLRRLLVDVWITFASRKEDPEAFLKQSDLPADFMRDLALLFVQALIADIPSRRFEAYGLEVLMGDRCKYHQHDAGDTLGSTKCLAPGSESKFSRKVARRSAPTAVSG